MYATERGLPFGLAGLLGALLGLIAWILGGKLLGSAAIITGLLALSLALIPAAQAFGLAAREQVSLSLVRYFFGIEPPDVKVTRDVEYTKVGSVSLRLDVYQPLSPRGEQLLPALIVVHGGGWNGGAKGEMWRQSRLFAADGMVVFDIDYRLAGPQKRFPAPVADVKCTIGWVRQNAASFGADPERIALLGRSAGAHLALLAAYTPTDSALPPSCPAAGTSVKAVVSFYAPVDLAWGYAHPPRPDFYDGPAHLRNFLGGPPDSIPEVYRLASPHLHVTSSSPPTLAIHGMHDQLVRHDQLRILQNALETAGVPHHVVVLPWGTHGFDYFRSGWGSQIVEPLILRFLRAHLP